jgi:hypothetical protein
MGSTQRTAGRGNAGQHGFRLERWNVEQHHGAAVEATVDGGAAVLRVLTPGDGNWHVQFNQPKLVVKKGAVYTAAFRASADGPRKIHFSLMQAHDPWGNLGLEANVALGKEPRQFTFTFIANEDDGNARLNFGNLSQQGAQFRISDVSLKPGGRVGLGEGESLEQRSIRVPKFADSRSLTATGRRDWIAFLWETERKHWTEMRRFLKQELGVQVPIAATIVATSTPNLMAEMDIVDSHAYWEHPQFPGLSWDMDNWIVRNISMVDHPEWATVTRLAMQRVAGKPHMVSEYNHPAPNTHAGEGPLVVAAFGALQDWDAIFLYTYSHEERETKAGCIPGFFSIGPHPTIMANVPIASLLFRRGDLSPARQLLSVPLPPDKEIELVAKKGHAWSVLPAETLGLDLRNAVLHRVALDTSGRSPAPDAPAPATEQQSSDTGELCWRLPGKDQGVLELRGSRTKAVLGHVDNQRIDLGHGVRVSVDRTRTNWCSIALTLLEGDLFDRGPRRALLVATGITENTDMGWRDETRSTVGKNWGKPPSLVEPIAATIELPRNGPAMALYPLDERGQRGPSMPVESVDGNRAKFRIGPPQAAIWYEIDYTDGK